MRKPEFMELKRALVRGGVAPFCINRTLAELRDHYDDLEAEALRTGCSTQIASAEARNRLGSHEMIAQEIVNRPELRFWVYRWPWVPALLRQFVVAASVSTLPVVAVADRIPAIARWGLSTGLALLLTSAMLLLMHGVIVSGLPV